MASNKKPRKKHKQRDLLNPIAAASRMAGKLTDAERLMLINPVWECFAKLRQGKPAFEDFKHLVDCMNVAMALTMPGMNLLPDHRDKFSAAQDALQALGTRWGNGGSWTCYAAELEAIRTGIEYHDIQLQFASAGEVTRATQVVDNQIKGAVSGSPGKNHLHINLRAA